MEKKTNLIKLWTPVVFWLILIFFLSSQPSPPPTAHPFFDLIIPYLAHLGIYFVLFVLLFRATKNFLVAFLLAAIYGLSDEFHQAFVPTRDASSVDFLVDLLGISLAAFLIWKLLPEAPEKLKNWAKKLDLT